MALGNLRNLDRPIARSWLASSKSSSGLAPFLRAPTGRTLVEEAWSQLEPILEDSQFKVTFRAFGW